MIRAGLFLYDHLASRRTLPRSARVDLARGPFAAGLKPSVVAGFSYADCWVEDSRLVVLNAIDARERGAQIRTRCRFEGARREGGLWEARLSKGGQTESIAARAIVNAAGPWVANALRATGSNTEARVRLIKGSHIVVPKLYDGAHAFILQNDDERVVFAIPYEGRYTLIGTTDVLFSGDPADIAITPDEVTYLCRALSRTFASAPTPADVVWSYAGVRPLYDDDASDPSAITRDYVLELDGGAGRAPLLSIFGGKITTYRRLAEEALHKLGTVLPISEPAWTARSVLPGGDIGSDLAAFEARTRARYPWLPAPTARRLVRAYGSRVDRILDGAGSLSDLGDDLGAGLSSHEVAYLRREEWAVTATDILWRRSKLGLHGGPALAQRLESWLSSHPAA
jgi:glycerol-3-phosphate dehydrogenase